MKRSGPLKRVPMTPRRKRRRTANEAAMSRAWHDAVLSRPGPPLVLSSEEPVKHKDRLYVSVVQAHHLIPQQVLRRRARTLGLDEAVLVWDVRVGVKVSTRRHQRHHSGHEPIRRAELDGRLLGGLIVFAGEYGLEAWLERHLPVDVVPPPV